MNLEFVNFRGSSRCPAPRADRGTKGNCRRCSSTDSASFRRRSSKSSRRSHRDCRSHLPASIPASCFLLAALFFSSTGAPPLTPISTSRAPSLSKSPTARPRAAKYFLKCRAGLLADVAQFAIFALMEQQQRLLVLHLHGVVVDHVVGMAVGQNQIHRAIVVVVEDTSTPSRSAGASPGPRRWQCATSRKVSSLLLR